MVRFRLIAAVLLGVLAFVTTVASPASAAARLGERTLRLGSEGGDVKQLQRLLTRSGFRAPADGTFGPGTRTAVRGFQRAATLKPTGVAGRGTIKLLRAAAESVAAPPPATDGGATFGPAPTPPPAAAAAAPVAERPAGPAGSATPTPDGTGTAPAGAPAAVVKIIEAANRIATLPYRYGGGHGSFDDTAYDCSGSVSYALHGAGLVDRTMVSGEFETFGAAGPGRWVTTYANGGHMYMIVAGLRFDTSGQKATGSRWQTAVRSNEDFVVRHPAGL